jgi:hypothetical protein
MPKSERMYLFDAVVYVRNTFHVREWKWSQVTEAFMDPQSVLASFYCLLVYLFLSSKTLLLLLRNRFQWLVTHNSNAVDSEIPPQPAIPTGGIKYVSHGDHSVVLLNLFRQHLRQPHLCRSWLHCPRYTCQRNNSPEWFVS